MMGRVCGFQTERAVVKLPARRSRYNDITRHASAAAFDPLTPISLSVRRGGEGVPSLGQPAWGGGHPYLPTQNVAHPPYPIPPKNPKPWEVSQTVLVKRYWSNCERAKPHKREGGSRRTGKGSGRTREVSQTEVVELKFHKRYCRAAQQ